MTGLKAAQERHHDAGRMDEALGTLKTVFGESGRPSNGVVVRKKPLERLIRNPFARLVVVQGPAGFGKTTLLRQYCAYRTALGDKIGWIHLEAHHSDPGRFLRILCDAVDDKWEAEGEYSPHVEFSGASVADFQRAVRRLKTSATIVIDGFEQSSEPGLNAVVAQLVRVLPEQVRLCIGTRKIPAINLARLQVREQALLIKAEQLRFSLNETSEFFADSKDLSWDDVALIHRMTDGWPAALQCFRLCLRGRGTRPGVIRANHGVTPELINYLATEVFESLPDDRQKLLLQLCLPERLCGALVERITDCPDGDAQIDEIDHAGLFLSSIDCDGYWFRFHNVFRRFLLSRLERELPVEERRRRHRRIADWFADSGRADEAILHLLEAGDLTAAAGILTDVIDQLVAEERLGLIVQIVDQLPLDLVVAHENVRSAAVVAYAFRREFDKANRIVGLRQDHLEKHGGTAEDWGTHNYGRIFIYAAQDRVRELEDVAVKTLDQLDERYGFKFAVGFNALAFCQAARSQFEDARETLLQARSLHDRVGSLFGLAYQESIYSTVLSAQGRINDAIRCLRQALRRIEEGGSSGVVAGAVVSAYLARALYEVNRIDEAEALIDEYGPLVEQQAVVDPLAAMFLTSARVAWLREEQTEAEETLERAIFLGHRYGLARMVDYARAELARHATLAGDLERAAKYLANRVPVEDGFLFHASEAESMTITEARYHIACDRHGEARAILQAEWRKAKALRRVRRLLKIQLLQAISLNAEGQTNAARRAFIDALNIGAAGGFIRTFLDEGAMAIRLIRETRQAVPRLPDLPHKDVLVGYMDRLLTEAGETPSVAAIDADEDDEEFSPHLFDQLTDRERDILRHVANGFSNKDLADRLFLSTNTVKWHLRNIFQKLRIANRMQAVSVARHFGLID